MDCVKSLFKPVLSQLLKLFFIFPVKKNRVLFISFEGNQYSCNPKYFYLYLLENYKDKFHFVWALNDKKNAKLIPAGKTVRYNSLKYLYFFITSGLIVNNNPISTYIPKRKAQIFLETWHGGGAYKKIALAYDKKSSVKAKKEYLKKGERINFYISSCEKFTEVQSLSLAVSRSKFINTGLPRNTVFYKSNVDIKKKVYSFFNIGLDVKTVLYAPTYRGGTGYKLAESAVFLYEADVKKIINALKKDEEKWIFMSRDHYFKKIKNNFTVNANDYPDMQELLASVDVLITDYSSSMWDFSLTKKPAFLYTPDIDEYIKNRGFYTDPKTWPYPISKTINELLIEIKGFDKKRQEEKIAEHHRLLGSYENENACKKVFNHIFKKLMDSI